MNLIDRYIYAVILRLPEEIREDVGRELQANIEDMLPDNPSEEEIVQVLEELGSPNKLANSYQPKKKYVIGPALYDQYFSVLKIVITIFVLVSVGISILEWVLNPLGAESVTDSIVNITTELVVTIIQGAMQGFIWVTIAFMIIERTDTKINKKWSPHLLPKCPSNDKAKISRGETIFSLFCTILFTFILYLKPGILAIMVKDDYGNFQSTPLFSQDRLESYITVILLLAVIQILFFIWKIITTHWTIPLAVTNVVINILVCIFFLVFINDQYLFNEDITVVIAKLFKTEWMNIAKFWNINIKLFQLIFVIICIWDSGYTLIKAWRANEKGIV